MVLLAMTPSIVEALGKAPMDVATNSEANTEETITKDDAEQRSLQEPAVGKPIAHGQVVDLWKRLQASGGSGSAYSLEHLLRGTKIYVPPPPPKKEPSPEYKALMARLRYEEEARTYERMVNNTSAGPRMETFADRFPLASAHAFASVNQPISKADMGDSDVTYADVNRQVLLIFNFLVSILGVAATLWAAARWWSLPARLFLTMGGSIVVGIAEVTVYSIYVWRMDDAKQRQEAVKEVKEVTGTWIVGKDGDADGTSKDDKSVLLQDEDNSGGVRKRTAVAKPPEEI